MLYKQDICKFLDDGMMEFSAYVLLHRAFPLLTDGLKVSYRRILYTMYKEHMTKLTKSANVSGAVMKIHPHGDCYPTIVNMVQKDNNINPFITGKGSFGYHTSKDIQPASSRYSEVMINDYSLDMMKNLDKNSVDMIPTFDGESLEPKELPVKHPQVLTIAQQGMGVGFSNNMPSFNLEDVCNATIKYIETGEKTIIIPDFATGGKLMYSKDSIDSINNKGTGTFKLRSSYEVEGDYILIKEIPFTSTREDIIDKVINVVKAGKIKEIIDIRDSTDIKGMEIEIKLKKNADVESVMNKLYLLTPLESSFSANMTILHNDSPCVMGVWDIIPEWIKWRKECIVRVSKSEIKSLSKTLHILEGLEKCLIDIDKVIDIIKNEKEQNIIKSLCSYFSIDEIQANEVSDMKLRDINKDKIVNKIKSIDKVRKQIKSFEKLVSSDDMLNIAVIKGLQEVISKYSSPRRTEIIYDTPSTPQITKLDTIEDYNCNIVFTKENYIKKTRKYSDTQKVKDGDIVLQQIKSTNKSKLLLFTDKANCYYLNTYDLSETQPSNLGDYLPSELKLDDEKVLYVVSTIDFSGNMIYSFENGKIVKVPLKSYIVKTNRTKMIKAYSTLSPLVSILYVEQDVDILLQTADKRYAVINTSIVCSKDKKDSQGAMTMRTTKGKLRSVTFNNLSEVESKACYHSKLGFAGEKLDL